MQKLSNLGRAAIAEKSTIIRLLLSTTPAMIILIFPDRLFAYWASTIIFITVMSLRIMNSRSLFKQPEILERNFRRNALADTVMILATLGVLTWHYPSDQIVPGVFAFTLLFEVAVLFFRKKGVSISRKILEPLKILVQLVSLIFILMPIGFDEVMVPVRIVTLFGAMIMSGTVFVLYLDEYQELTDK
ncbi:hypothetical protein HGB24_02940 [Candidatus Saccharibacteria bacterium]|nr:hypothetical protein [Candidatus Saccharibacteria bacterium]